MTWYKRKQIRNLVDEIRSFYKLEDRLNQKQLIYLIKGLGGELVFNQELDTFARIEKDIGEFPFIITIKNSFETRDNFSSAHELGHLFLHMGYLIDEDKWKNAQNLYDRFLNDSEDELEANQFAGNLLMPEEKFIKLYKPDMEQNVAEYFNVSVSAVDIRAKYLNLKPWFID